MKFKWLLFDLDNTLMDFSNASKKSFVQTLGAYNITLTPEVHNIYRKINTKVWEDFESQKITAVELRTLRFERFFKAIDQEPCPPATFSKQYLNGVVEYSEVYPGVFDMLDNLKSKYKLSIITNGLKEVQRPRLQRSGLIKYFDSIIVSDEIGVAKPQKAFFQHTYQSIENPPEKDHTLVIGDSLNSDILGGNNFGLKTCWVNPNGKTFENVVPHFEVKDIRELESHL